MPLPAGITHVAERPKTQAEARAGADEFVYSLTDETRAAMKLDVRYALRDGGNNRAQDFPLLTLLGQTMDRNLNRIRFPAEVLTKLTAEVESLRPKLPPDGPLVDLVISASKYLLQPPAPGGTAALSSAASNSSFNPPAPDSPAPRATRSADRSGAAPKPAKAQAVPEDDHSLKSAALQVEVTYVTTMELGDQALAGYLKYCLGVGEYGKIIEALRPRATKAPRVWVWSLLTTAMRLSEHKDFPATAKAFHIWLAATHPETVIDSNAKDERRRFSVEKIAAIETRELE